ncbi:unnamed protein product [Kluyveromyces dobzhanskii CBS 2104]|uniref:WGS project CCBQ000000000 data, contig 00017 n=1 Tax=Kluyveromyces dobzhanskii CBS 2104 TaxID=1427455 RepID=A0A0A8L616_9SACH|nr:unnamed protein product [Kluyveromyces dobzhanskii CBS 2104]
MAEVGVRIAQDQNIATVWLLSSLGSSHSVNVKKKEIVKVSIPNTCQILASEQVSMPLRHTGQLLYGVTVCYERKTGFILADVHNLRDAVQRQWIGLKPLGSHSGGSSNKSRSKLVESQVITKTANNFLQDDPNFDMVMRLKMDSNLDALLNGDARNNGTGLVNTANGSGIADKNAIRQDDMWREMEIGNEPYYDARSRAHTASSGQGLRYGIDADEYEEDDLAPIDVELNFRLDEVLTDNESEAANLSAVNSDLGLNYNNDATHGIDLNMPRLEEAETSDTHLAEMKRRLGLDYEDEDEDGNDPQENDANTRSPPQKRQKVANSFQKIKIDDSIGQLTDTLRYNHENYVEIMKQLHARKLTRGKSVIPDWKQLFVDEDQPSHVLDLYAEIFQPFSSTNFQQGRKGRAMHSTGDVSRSSSVLSLEHGRRMDFANVSSSGDSNRLNLNNLPEQINEYNEFMDMPMDDPEYMELDIPPSSFGRNVNRVYTADLDSLEDLRGYEQQRRIGLRGDSGSGDFLSGSDSLTQTLNENQQLAFIHDRQTEKFFRYISERAKEVGKRTVTFPGYSRKFLFEDIIPSKLSQEEDQEVISVTKRIACNAFLSLLQLATSGKLKIDLYDVGQEKSHTVLNGDDIVVYC